MSTKNIAFEVSDNHEQHAHILPLIIEFIEESGISITLYSLSEDHIVEMNCLAQSLYGREVVAKTYLSSISNSYKLKHFVVYLTKLLKLSKVLSILRKGYGGFRKKSKYLEGGNDFYKRNNAFFKEQDAVFTTELKGGSVLKSMNTKLIFCLHGIAANDNSFFKDWSCDLVLTPLNSTEGKLREFTNFPTSSCVYNHAYLKRDIITLQQKLISTSSLFINKQYTFVYNPHWDNSLGQSSWEKVGLDILEFFYTNSNYNLIFAPHIALNKYFGLNVPNKYSEAGNIHVDIDSKNLCNGYYIPFSDCYIGDVSSQYFEFLLCKPNISAIFINLTQIDWTSSNNFEYWKNGIVINSIGRLADTVESVTASSYKNTTYYDEYFSSVSDNQALELKAYLKETIL